MIIPAEQYAAIQAETDRAIQKGYDAAHAEWRAMALEYLYETCLQMPTFTVNDFRKKVRASSLQTHDNRAMGGVMVTGRRLGWMKPTGEAIPSRVGHKVPLQIWQSLVYKPYQPTLL